jgi:5-methylcytosine-specific restriction endonuclease McrA
MNQSARRAAWQRQDAKTSQERWILDGGICQAEGCFCEGETPHHVVPKRSGGTSHEYTINEKITLCRFHHAQIHDAGETVLLKDFRIIGPRGVVD